VVSPDGKTVVAAREWEEDPVLLSNAVAVR
jgi:hypothetical protein